MMNHRSYSEMAKYFTFEERFEYLKLGGEVGKATFGFDRWINQRFYTSREWKRVRDEVILRDEGCDLGILDRAIFGGIVVHHINPMLPNDVIHGEEWIINPEFLVTTTAWTHNAIHYGDDKLLPKVVLTRSPNDTKLW